MGWNEENVREIVLDDGERLLIETREITAKPRKLKQEMVDDFLGRLHAVALVVPADKVELR